VRDRPGGLGDLDAALRWLQLRRADVAVRAAEVAPGLAKLAQVGVLDEARARRLVSAHQLLRQVENLTAAALGDRYDADSAPRDFPVAVARACDAGDFAEMQAMIETAAAEISALSDLMRR
jgi:glutamine synthetase adenylyltransferase